MKQNTILTIVSIAVIVLSLIAAVWAYLRPVEPQPDPNLKIVEAPEQTKAQRPPCFPDPEANYIPMPDGVNLAEKRPIASGEHTDVYVATNVNDGKTDTYWESKGFPAEMTVELDGSHAISVVAVRLNPSAIWEKRTQEIAVLVSKDGTTFTEVVPAARYDFDPATGNRIRIDFEPISAVYVKIVFTLNTSSRTGGAQAAEIEIYE